MPEETWWEALKRIAAGRARTFGGPVNPDAVRRFYAQQQAQGTQGTYNPRYGNNIWGMIYGPQYTGGQGYYGINPQTPATTPAAKTPTYNPQTTAPNRMSWGQFYRPTVLPTNVPAGAGYLGPMGVVDQGATPQQQQQGYSAGGTDREWWDANYGRLDDWGNVLEGWYDPNTGQQLYGGPGNFTDYYGNPATDAVKLNAPGQYGPGWSERGGYKRGKGMYYGRILAERNREALGLVAPTYNKVQYEGDASSVNSALTGRGKGKKKRKAVRKANGGGNSGSGISGSGSGIASYNP